MKTDPISARAALDSIRSSADAAQCQIISATLDAFAASESSLLDQNAALLDKLDQINGIVNPPVPAQDPVPAPAPLAGPLAPPELRIGAWDAPSGTLRSYDIGGPRGIELAWDTPADGAVITLDYKGAVTNPAGPGGWTGIGTHLPGNVGGDGKADVSCATLVLQNPTGQCLLFRLTASLNGQSVPGPEVPFTCTAPVVPGAPVETVPEPLAPTEAYIGNPATPAN